METLSKGQRLSIAEAAPSGALHIGLAAHGLTLDFACFGLDAAGTLADERYMTFFNQPLTPCGGVQLETLPGDDAGFAFQLARLPSTIERIVIAATMALGSTWRIMMRNGPLRLPRRRLRAGAGGHVGRAVP